MTESHPETAPPLPIRTPLRTQTTESAFGLWREGECCDLQTLERVAAGLRNISPHTDISQHSTQQEVDGVIARWRAAQPGHTKGRP